MTCPVYLFAGPEVGEKNDEISKLRAQACKKYGTLDEYSFYTADTRVADVMSILDMGIFSKFLFYYFLQLDFTT